MGFWPDDITSAEVVSPREIMQRAGDELGHRTKVLSVSVRESRLPDRIVLAFTITNLTYSLEFNLFEASHQIDQVYPVLIVPPTSNIPEFLRRERRIPGRSGASPFAVTNQVSQHMAELFGGTPDKIVKNEWISATPTEFAEKLTKLFALDHMKSRIVSLQAPVDFARQGVEPENSEEGTDADSSGDTSEPV